MITEYDPHHGQNDSQQQQQQQQQRASTLEHGRAIKLMRNGDSFFPGRSFVINQRKYPMLDVLLDDASQALRANFGAVRCIYTPKSGTRLHDISELEDHRTYVASGGEKFKKLHYLDIADGKRVQSKERGQYRLPPVRRFDVEGRALKLSRSENVIIYAYRNGDPLTLPSKVLLVKPTLQNWESVLDEVTRKVSLSYSAVLKLYAMNGELITSAQQLEFNGMYVAAGKERFKRIEYPDPKSISPNSSPKMSRKSYTRSDGTNTHTTTANSHGSVEHGGQRRPVREEYDFFNNKPQQHRRGPTKETDLDRDDGGIYKGRLNHREHVREIDETHDTKVDLPVDYREVETVEDENLFGNAGKTPRRHHQPPSQPKSNRNFTDSPQRSPPPPLLPSLRSVKTPPKTYEDHHDDDDKINNRFGMNNGHHQKNNHHDNTNGKGFDDDYQRHTPPAPLPIDDGIIHDQNEQQMSHSTHHKPLGSPSSQPNRDNENHAATVIQSHVRGYISRKHSHIEKQRNTDKLINNHDQQQREAHKHEENKLNQHYHESQPNESLDNTIEPLADLTVERAIREALNMGANGSSEIQVSFNRPNLFYFAGEQIAGNISFQNTENKLELDAIFLECVGELGYSTQEVRHHRDANGNQQTEHYTKYHQVPFLKSRVSIVQPEYGQREIILYRGQYSWPFQFVLPNQLPPSLIPSTTTYPYVKYYARIVLDKPWYKPNAKQVYPLTIFPRVDLRYVPGGQQQVSFSNENRKKIRLQGYLMRGGILSGETLSIHIRLDNPKRSEIKRIKATLIQHRQVARSYHAETICRLDLPDLREFNGKELQRNFDLVLPEIRMSPTYTYMSQYLNQTLGISIRYELILDVKVRGLFTDFKVSIPIIVGTEQISAEQQPFRQPINNPIEMPTASAPVFDYEELPPSYDTVVMNQKI
ncbi:unnamed protein product [Rotaria socialis]|uniref:Doublecortin domain-containing protein n=1 Tax=Rotaria socialis TaxID=392032 RepID=A0A818AY20_9BILA|nr:unnamed protein product [Rotaria socialis]CAF3417801.1 unnamed protein product [Rotaria socialis]